MAKRKEAIVNKVPENFGEKLDLIINILNSHLTQNNKKILFETLKEIQKKKEISLEFVKYLLLGISKRSDLKKINEKRKKKAEKIINKFYHLLKNSGINIELKPVTYYYWNENIDLIKRPAQRFLRFFRI